MKVELTQHLAPCSATMNSTNTAVPTATVAIDQAHRKAKRTKIKDARSRLLLIIACLAYIVTVFTTLSMGLQDISQYLEPGLQQARVELRTQGNTRHREEKLSAQLQVLLDSRLGHGFRFGETYEDCLVRGLQKANKKLEGHGFDYPDIRNQTMEWVTDECIRLMYVPQPLHPSPQQVILTRWASASFRARRVYDKTVKVVASGLKHLAAVLGIRPAKIPARAADLTRERDPLPVPTLIPFHFTLVCNGTAPCRLAYPKTSAGVDKVAVAKADLVKNYHRVEMFSRFCAKVNLLQTLMMSLALLFTSMMVLPSVTYLVAGIYLAKGMPYPQAKEDKAQRPISKNVKRFTAEEIYTLGSLLLQVITMIFHTVVQCECFQPGTFTLVTGIAMYMMGLSMAINFFVPIAQQAERFTAMREAFKDLYFMIVAEVKEPAAAVPPQVNEAVDTPGAADEPANELSQDEVSSGESAMLIADGSRMSQLPLSLPLPLASTISGDLRDQLDTMRQERMYEASVQTDSDSDFDGEEYVDLSDRITPTDTDADSDEAVIVNA